MAPSFRLQIAAALGGLLIIGALLLRASTVEPAAVVALDGGTFTEGVVGVPQHINPLLAGSPSERDLSALLFAGLTRLDAAGNLAPDLAATWQVSSDNQQYTFFLRGDARWSDGEAVTADDVLFTIELLQSPDFPADPALASLWQAVKVTKLDRLSVRFDLPQPYSPFFQYTTVGLLPAHLLRDVPPAKIADAAFNAAPLGAGRWRIVRGRAAPGPTPGAAQAPTPDPDRGLLLEPNPYAGPAPHLHRLWFRFYPTAGALAAAFTRGEVDSIAGVEPEAVAGLAGQADVHLYSAELPTVQMILLNLRVPLFAGREVRQALLRGLDRAALLGSVGGQGQVADSPLLASSWAYSPTLARYTADPGAAGSLLDGAGWQLGSDGARTRAGLALRFTLVYQADNPAMATLAEEVRQQWRRIGVAVTLRAQPREQLVSDVLGPRSFEAVLIGWRGVPNDPDVYQLWHSTQMGAPGANFAGFGNDRADLALETGRQTLNRADRLAAYREFQQVFADEVPALPLYVPRYTYAVRARVGGVSLPLGRDLLPSLIDPSARFQSLASWYLLSGAGDR